MYLIIDWASNICFHGKTFETFEDAWGFLYETFPDGAEDGTFDDYFVLSKEEFEPIRKRTKL